MHNTRGYMASCQGSRRRCIMLDSTNNALLQNTRQFLEYDPVFRRARDGDKCTSSKRGRLPFWSDTRRCSVRATCCPVCARTAWAVLVAIFYLGFAVSLMRSLSSIETPRVGRCFRGTTERLDTNTSEGRYQGGVNFTVPPCQEAP
jgi:hypothetical protein